MVALARDRGIRVAYVPSIDAAEAALVPDITVYAVENLTALLTHLGGGKQLPLARPDPTPARAMEEFEGTDFAEIYSACVQRNIVP